MRKLKRKLSLVVAVICCLIFSSGGIAFAYGTPTGKWPSGSLPRYCLSGSVSGTPNWSSWISTNVSKWNAITGSNKPIWSNGPGGCNMAIGKLNVGGCGLSNRTYVSGIIQYSYYDYNSGSAFWRGTNTGGCNFDWTTLHEFAHCNGHEHSGVSTAVMWGADNARTAYQTDDINAVRANYP